MPSSRRTKPIIIAASKPTRNPPTLSLPTPPSPKQVRFAPRSAELASRPLTPQEAWALYHFETHARGCRLCSNHSLCSTGYGLAQDVQVLMCQHGGEICSTRPDSEGKWIRLEIPHGYDRARSMLGVERIRKREKKHAPIVNYEIVPRPAPKQELRDNVYVEPARTHGDDERRVRYHTEGERIQLPESTKRGSLYESDMRRPRREYCIEERLEPTPKGELTADQVWKEREREERRERRRRERDLRGGMLLPELNFEKGASRQATHDQSFMPAQSNQSLGRGTEFTGYVCPRSH